MKSLSGVSGFEWDEGNRGENFIKHQVADPEAEETFFNEPHILLEDEKHSTAENGFALLGKTAKGRKLFVVFTVRGDKIRIISARDMSKKEKALYEKLETDTEI